MRVPFLLELVYKYTFYLFMMFDIKTAEIAIYYFFHIVQIHYPYVLTTPLKITISFCLMWDVGLIIACKLTVNHFST